MAYIGTSPSNGVRRRFVYVATSNQTSFSGNDENGVSLVYVDVAYLDVYQNGVKLKSVDDYASTTGTSVVLVQGASTDDIIEIIAYDVFSVADTVSAKDGGNFAGNVGMGGTLGVTGVSTLTGAVNTGAGLTVANGITLTDGNLVVASGHGIDFSANSNAAGMSSELLHHYEEGTFTAKISTDSEYTGETQSGVYTKIGDIVFIQIRFQKSGTLNSGSNARFGLPFTSANNGVQSSGFRGSVENIDTSVVGVGGTIAANGAILFLNEMTAAVTGSNLNGNDLGANFQIQIQGFYKAA